MTPKLPSVRELARRLHILNSGIAPTPVVLTLAEDADEDGEYPPMWILAHAESDCYSPVYGLEVVPGRGVRHDAHAAARRLLSDARAAMKGMR